MFLPRYDFNGLKYYLVVYKYDLYHSKYDQNQMNRTFTTENSNIFLDYVNGVVVLFNNINKNNSSFELKLI